MYRLDGFEMREMKNSSGSSKMKKKTNFYVNY